MSTPLKNVAVVGGSGNVGTPLVRELLAQGFAVTVLTRTDSQSAFQANVAAVHRVDFGSLNSLVAALRGQDAVVSTIGAEGLADQQRVLADAAVAAGVRRFVPSEFGLNVPSVAVRVADGSAAPGEKGLFALLGAKHELEKYLDQLASKHETFSWTGLSTGSFFDWSLKLGLYGFDKATKTATIYDSGNESFQASSLAFVARSVAGVLSHPDASKNKYLSVAGSDSLNGSGRVSQNEILKIIEAETGAKWTVKHIDTNDLEKTGLDLLAKGQYHNAFVPLLLRFFLGDGQGHALKVNESDNALLGLQEEDLVPCIKTWLKN